MLMGVTVDQIEMPFDAQLEQIKQVTAVASTLPAKPKYAYLVGPESNAGFKALAELQKASVPVYRAAKSFDVNGKTFAPGTWIVSPSAASAKILEAVAKDTGVAVYGTDRAPNVDGYRIKPGTRIGLYRGANVMPGGWMMWLFEQYGFNFQVVSAEDFKGDLSAKYDTIVFPSGLLRQNIVRGLDPARNDPKEWAWAFGVGEDGWKKLGDFVKNGGTLVAVGSSVDTARQLLDLPIEKALPEAQRRRFGAAASEEEKRQVAASELERQLKDAFSSPARLMQTLRDRVAEPESLFYCPGSLLMNEFDTAHPVAFGMPASWPVFFETDQAYRIRPGFDIDAHVVARYPRENILQSGWLLGEEYLRDQANVVAFTVGKGTAVTLGSQIDYRTQPRGTIKLLFNAMFHGPSTPVSASQMQRLGASATN
jgi:hypothetical protein